ncbi:GGDEF domain-containing protein [Stakelama marina]|uniref:diguanylate cyclase n=1 Tax=Stakelama marina TaxID=2826939 RepID=A0A8T4IJB5_9SPHN|nr:GGDEF domain-containing protein [Stakelama marina]MBR0553205.1 GGDEF domain-containing protein [Stakelama marina]
MLAWRPASNDRAEPAADLFDRIGAFLRDQRLQPNPANYTFAYHVLSDPEGALAKAVARLTDGGIRLTREEVESLGHQIDGTRAGNGAELGRKLVAQAQMQVAGFEDMVHRMRSETADFGKDIEASTAALRESSAETGRITVDNIVEIAANMVERVEIAEGRLEAATREAADLRSQLEEAQDNARRDPLTELPNRRAFEEAFAELDATDSSACLAVCDVDHFKDVNDRFGHAVGDRVLRAIGAQLAESCSGHLVARYGGEEFAVLLSGVGSARAKEIIESARQAIAAKRYRQRETHEPLGEITVSAGLTEIGSGETFAQVFQRADELLYRAKLEGRNCLHLD